jgi:DNA-binding MarR family transcriptional regulator
MQEPIFRASLTLGRVRELACRPHPDLEAHALQWLLWLPFLNAEELARCLGCKGGTIYRHLRDLLAAGLVEAVSFPELERRRQQRYYVTDAGLYVYALHFTPALDVAALARQYPVTEHALLRRLTRPAPLLLLADVASRLVGDGRGSGFQMVRWKQPWLHSYTDRTARRRRLSADAAFGITSTQGDSQQFCVLLDMGEHRQPGYRKERALLRSLLAARDARFWQGGTLPFPLLVTEPHRLASWGRQLAAVCEQRSIAIPPGALTTFDRLRQGGFAPIWWTFREVASFGLESSADCEYLVPEYTPPHRLERFCAAARAGETPADPVPGPRCALHLQSDARPLKRYVRGGFAEAALHLRPADLLPDTTPPPTALVRLTALLNLRLSDVEKDILTWLARHTLLALPDLRGLVADGEFSLDCLRRHTARLLGLNLLGVKFWDEGPSGSARVRYYPREMALRFCALRGGLPATHYLTRDPRYTGHPTAEHPSPWVQRGLQGLLAQLGHTAGVYSCMVAVICATRTCGVTEILAWRSARESVRSFLHTTSGTSMQLRPDGEVLYREPPGSGPLRTILLEYDRGTMSGRDYRKKFTTYQAYWLATGTPPPLVLFVTQRPQSVRLILSSAQQIEGLLPLQILLESDLLAAGLVMNRGRFKPDPGKGEAGDGVSDAS